MAFRLPVSLSQVLRHTITPPKQALPSRFFSSQPVYRSQCLSPVARRPIPLSIQVPRSTLKPTTSFYFIRSFSTTRQNMMRPNYFPRSGRSGSGGPTPKAGFFRRLLIRLESYPHTYIVSPPPRSTSLWKWLMKDIRSTRSKHCNLLSMGIRQNLISAIQRSITLQIHDEEFPN